MELTIDEILDEAYELGMLQNKYEIKNTIDFLKTKEIKNFLEIGTNQGGTFICWAKICDIDGLKIKLNNFVTEYNKFYKDEPIDITKISVENLRIKLNNFYVYAQPKKIFSLSPPRTLLDRDD